MTDTRTFFAVQHVPSGKLLRLMRWDDDSAELVLEPADLPVFSAESLAPVADVLDFDVPSHSSTPERPSIDPDLAREDLSAVSVTVVTTTTIQSEVLPLRLRLDVVSSRDIPVQLARVYGVPAEYRTPSQKLVAWLVRLQEGQTLEQLQAAVGQVVYSRRDHHNRRRLFAARAVPEEEQHALKGAEGALLVCSLIHG